MRRSPSPETLADLRLMSPSTVRKETLLPDPDSPTTPSVSPRAMENVTPSTALTSPSSVGNWTFRSLTSSSGSATRPPHDDDDARKGVDQLYLTRGSRNA